MEYKVGTCSITVCSLSFSIFNELCFVRRFTVGMLWRLQIFFIVLILTTHVASTYTILTGCFVPIEIPS